MLTLQRAVEEIAEVVAGQCPIVDGKLNEDVVRRINEAGEQLATFGDWADMVSTYVFSTRHHCLSLPVDITAIRHATICGAVADIRSLYFQYIGPPSAYAPGVDCHPRLEFQGKFATLENMENPRRIVVITDRKEDEGVALTITGQDQSNLPVRQQQECVCLGGADIPISKCQPMVSKQYIWKITSITKPKTCGVVWVYAYDLENDQLLEPLATLLPGETFAEYKRFFVPGICEDEEACVNALVKMGWNRTYTDPADILPIDNAFALKSMVKALHFHRNNEPDGYKTYVDAAVASLKVQKVDDSMGQEPEIKKQWKSRFTQPVNRSAQRSTRGRIMRRRFL